jgi:hypothetical protein
LDQFSPRQSRPHFKIASIAAAGASQSIDRNDKQKTGFFDSIVQLLTAARIYGKLRFPPEGRLYPLLHRWSGRAAILLTLPAAYHCIFKLGFGTYDARAFIHSLLGASFYGAFSAKVLIVRTSGYPGWALPMAGGVLFAILMVLWLTSAFWLFGTHGVSL